MILQFPQLIERVSIVLRNPGHSRTTKVDAVMVGPDSSLGSLNKYAVRPRAPRLGPSIPLKRSEHTRSLGHVRHGRRAR